MRGEKKRLKSVGVYGVGPLQRKLSVEIRTLLFRRA